MFRRCLFKVSFMLLLLTVLSVTVVFANENFTGTPIPDFQGLAWRATTGDIAKWASARGSQYVKTIEKYGVMTTLVYNGSYGGEPAEYRLTLYKGQFYQVNIYCESIPEETLIDKWRQFKQLLSQKYGNPSNDFYYFQSPYYDGDGYELQAIGLGKGTAITYWERPVGNGENIILSCEITTAMSINVSYQHVGIADIAVDDYNRHKATDM